MEKYFILFDNRPTESGVSKVNNIGIGACEAHSSEHIDLIDDTEGRHIYSFKATYWSETMKVVVNFYKATLRGTSWEHLLWGIPVLMAVIIITVLFILIELIVLLIQWDQQ